MSSQIIQRHGNFWALKLELMPSILFFDILTYNKKDHYTPLLHATIAEEASNYSNDMTADLTSDHDPEIKNKKYYSLLSKMNSNVHNKYQIINVMKDIFRRADLQSDNLE